MKSVKKLSVNRTTVRRLTSEEARKAEGGGPLTLRCGSQASACCPCTGTSTIGPSEPLYC